MNLAKDFEEYLLLMDFENKKQDFFVISNTGVEIGPITSFRKIDTWEAAYLITIDTFDTKTVVMIKHWAIAAIKTIEVKEAKAI